MHRLTLTPAELDEWHAALDRLEASLAHLERGARYAAEELAGKRLTTEQARWLEADMKRKATE